MDIDLLKEFVCVAEHLNFSKASKKLYIAQPVLSRHIAELEKQLGVQLFIRNKHSVQITYIGELMLGEARAVIERFDEAILKVKQTASGSIGTLRIGYLEAAVKKFIASLIMHFNRKYPNAELQPVSMDMGDLSKALKSGEIDIGFTLALDVAKSDDLHVKTLYSEYYSLVVPKEHPLAERSTIDISELAKEVFIMPSPENFPNAMEKLMDMFAERGIHPKIIKQSPRIDTVLLMVEIGLGLAIMPRHNENFASANVKFLDIMGCDAMIDVVVAWKKKNSNPLILPFIEELGLLV